MSEGERERESLSVCLRESKPRFPGKSQAPADTEGRFINLKPYHRGSGGEFIDLVEGFLSLLTGALREESVCQKKMKN